MILEHELIQLLRQKFDKVIENVKEDLATIRVGRAKPDMVEGITVPAYGSWMRLVELATIAVPDTNMLTVTPFDRSLMGVIEKAIGDSEMKLSPAVSGEMIRIVVPSLTQERRLDFVKLLKQKTESGKIMMRQVRQDVKEKVDALKEREDVSEDEVYKLLAELDKVTAEYNEKVEQVSRAKEMEIMAV